MWQTDTKDNFKLQKLIVTNNVLFCLFLLLSLFKGSVFITAVIIYDLYMYSSYDAMHKNRQ